MRTRIAIYVEGQTENNSLKKFLERWLHKQINSKRIGIDTYLCKGAGFFEENYIDKVDTSLNAPNSNVIAVFGLADYYEFPRMKKCSSKISEIQKRIEWASNEIQKPFSNDPRFRMFFAVHEIEAWFLCQTNIFPSGVKEKLKNDFPHPEHINTDHPPSEVINSAFRTGIKKRYDKVFHSRQLFEKLDPDFAATKCPNLKLFLEAILGFARTSSSS